jgi:excisionase family DNA binding protein
MEMVEARLSDWMSVTEAAAALGLTRQRVGKLVAEGALRSRRLGSQTLVRRDDVDARLDLRPAAGRRYSARRAWALILLVDGTVPPGLDAPTLSRLRSVARQTSPWEIRARLASRAERRNLRAHSSDLARLAVEDGVVRTGPRSAAEAGLGLIASDAPVELYVDAATARRLQRRYSLRSSDDPNVVLRVVPDAVRSWLTAPIAPRTAVALDLADDRDPRSQQVAREALSAP